MSGSTNTIRLHRVLRAPADRVYRAFLNPDAMAKWLPPHGFTGKVHEMDARVGGGYRMSFTNFSSGNSHSFGGTYLELVPHEKLRYTDRFDDPNLPGEMTVTVTLKRVSCGTELSATAIGHTGFTGTSLWIDWERDLYVVLLTNRVHPTRENNTIRAVRPKVHDAVVRSLT